jgi:hypothetical protein
MTKRKTRYVWLVEFEGLPRAIFPSFRSASAYTRQRRRDEPGLIVTTTKIESYLKEDEDESAR